MNCKRRGANVGLILGLIPRSDPDRRVVLMIGSGGSSALLRLTRWFSTRRNTVRTNSVTSVEVIASE